jgi:glycosyltransferase involved in cell wall biosynthesis
LFASGDSVTQAELRAICPRALRLEGRRIVDPLAHHVRMLELVAQQAENFDVVHFHTDYLHFPVTRRQKIAAITTLHGRLDIPDMHPLYREFTDMPLVSISNAQRKPMPWANWMATVYHGLPESLYRLHERTGKYLAFLGRISPEKRVDRAIEIARRAEIPIKIAAKIDPVDREYFDTSIRKLIDDPQIEFIGEIGEDEKQEFLGNALALLFPIDWPEPFGLVMIEAMACGTPVIAYKHGSVPEIIDGGTTGFLVDSIDAGATAAYRAMQLDRHDCRRVFEQRFSARKMCEDYVSVYQSLRDGEPDLTSGGGHLSIATLGRRAAQSRD